MLIVHHLNNSRSQRVLWLLEELGVPYEVKRYERNTQTMLAPPELKHVHPLGKSPVITDDKAILAETGLICEYLCDRYGQGRLAPTKSVGVDSSERLRWLYWLHYAEGSAMPPLLLGLVFGAMPQRAPVLMRPLVKAIAQRAQDGFVRPQIKLHLDYWEAELAESGWFAGAQFSAADVMMSFPVEAAATRVGDDPDRTNLKAFLERIHARPAYKRALERGGPYAYA
ncbi:glutathione S-transferase family protein [Caulobacter sp. S45]|uniref:glutathione S-transferase family protein n=1 Tax=Caulobacter sp. S45 TaxID=1641861 RepID=UPI0015766A07|nr:glutathione S-transferase [Caulobacter sp. S45]